MRRHGVAARCPRGLAARARGQNCAAPCGHHRSAGAILPTLHLSTSWAGRICTLPSPGYNRGRNRRHDFALDESLRTGVFGKLKLVICAPIPDLSGIGFFWVRKSDEPACNAGSRARRQRPVRCLSITPVMIFHCCLQCLQYKFGPLPPRFTRSPAATGARRSHRPAGTWGLRKALRALHGSGALGTAIHCSRIVFSMR
jgi:hypothetical protein